MRVAMGRRGLPHVAVAVWATCVFTPPANAQQPIGDLSTCRGEKLGSYIGKSYKRLQKIRPDARYVCSTCPMTMDFRLDRLTVTYDKRTRRIKTLRCV